MQLSDTALARARELVAEVVPEDVSDTGPDEDLRDYGLDSIRAMDVISRVNGAGGGLAFADLAGGPTLTIIASAFGAAAATEGNR